MGLAVGDAMGALVDFKLPGTFEPITGFRSSQVYNLNPGEWTDDTSLALCLASSLINFKGFDPDDQMRRYLKWYKEGT